jgi:hypothetical protein
MKQISIFFKSALGLGFTGLVMVAMAIIIGVNASIALNLVFASFYDANDRLEVLVVLEDDVRDNLQTIQLNQAYYAFSQVYGTESTDTLLTIEENFTLIDENINMLLDAGYFDPDWYDPASMALLQDFRQNLEAHRQHFNSAVTAFSESGVEDENAVFFEISDQASAVSDDLDALIRSLEEERQGFLLQTPGEISDAMWTFSGSLLLVLVLGLAAYRSIAGYLDPVLKLRNAVNAIKGDRYNPEMLDSLARKGGSVGDAAKSINDLAIHMEEAGQAGKQEVEDLRQAVYESRRRRLRIYHGGGQGSQTSEAGQ